jgi:tripartite-type tricarboxylate transporter receptor subunit TctC
VIRRLNAELVKALHSAAGEEWFAAQGGVAVGDSPEEFAAYIRADYERWGKLIRETGIKAE